MKHILNLFKLIISVLFIAAGFSFAAENNLDDILKKMEEADKKVSSAQFNYSQEILYTLTGEKQETSGTVFFKKPDKIKINQVKPLEQIITTDGKNVWVYTPSYGQVITGKWKQWASSSFIPSSLLSFSQGWADLKKNYSFTYSGQDNDCHLISMSPRQKDAWQLELWVTTDTFVPCRTKLSGDNITIGTKTSSYKVNITMDDKTFNFTAPKGTDILHLPN